MRLVMPALFIRLPARMKNGTASNGKLSMPLTMRWMTTKPGRVLSDSRMNSSAEPAMAMATGRPLAIRPRKMILSMGVLRLAAGSAIVHGGFGALQDRVATAPVRARHHDRAHRHSGEAQQADAVDPVHRQVDHGHARVAAQLEHHHHGEHG